MEMIKQSKMNKKGSNFLARDWVIAAIIFSGIIALFVFNVGSLADTYNNPGVTSDEFSERFDRFENNTAIAEDMFNAAKSGEGLSVFGTFDILFSSTFTIISLVFNSVTLVGSQVFGFVEFFGIPSEVGFLFGTIILSILGVIIVFIIISSVSRRDI